MQVQAAQVRDRKTCIEGTDFDIKRIKELIIEGREFDGYGEWESKKMSFAGSDISNNYRHWYDQMYLDRDRAGRKTAYIANPIRL